MQISHVTFDTASVEIVISGVANTQIYIVGIVVENNTEDDIQVRLLMNSPAEEQYGGATGRLYLHGRGHWGLPMTRDSRKYPYFISIDIGTSFTIQSVNSKRISGAVWYNQE